MGCCDGPSLTVTRRVTVHMHMSSQSIFMMYNVTGNEVPDTRITRTGTSQFDNLDSALYERYPKEENNSTKAYFTSKEPA